MNYDNFLGLLNKKGFSQPSLFKYVGGKFLDFQSHPSELLAIVMRVKLTLRLMVIELVTWLINFFISLPIKSIPIALVVKEFLIH
jgi:hypothetical protein